MKFHSCISGEFNLLGMNGGWCVLLTGAYFIFAFISAPTELQLIIGKIFVLIDLEK